MKIYSNILLLSFTAFSLFSIPLYAEIIDHKTFTRDTETGLDWLDVTETINKSYNEVEAQLKVGGKYQGYRFATAD